MLKARSLLIFLLSVLILVSIIVLVNRQVAITPYQKNSNFALTLYSVNVNVGFNQNSYLLNQSTRLNIYNFIRDNPGVNFRGLCGALNLSIGVVQYQINVLTKSGFVSAHRKGRDKRFFVSGMFTDDEIEKISILRGDKSGKIIEMLSENKSMSHKMIAEKLEITSQDLTWHIKSLKEENLIIPLYDRKNLNYSLNEEYATIIRRCISLIKNRT